MAVTVSVRGGLGNQLYIAAFAFALEAEGNEVFLDRSSIDNDETRAWVLDRFNVDIPMGQRRGQAIPEPDLLYHPEILKNYKEDVTLDGYFQSYKYWTPAVQEKIRSAFTLRRYPSPQSLAVANKITASNSAFLHVRRSDNLSVRGLAFHGLGSESYWSRAVGELCRLTPAPNIFVFSDDIEWCKSNPYFEGLTFVDHNSTGVLVDPEYALHKTDNGTEHEDLWLMSRCKHGIMATSTFSWWANWLGPHQTGGITVRPQQWFIGDFNKQSADMFPLSWVAK